jgi:hypothetical protein
MNTHASAALPTQSNSFATQYTSLILIVLAFTIGALVKPVEEVGGRAPEVAPPPVEQHKTQREEASRNAQGAVLQESSMGELVYSDLFREESSAINTERVGALATVLRSHDVRLDLQIYLQQNSTDASLHSSFERSIALSRALEARRVPAEAYRVRIVEQVSPHQAKAFFYQQQYQEEYDGTS